MQRRFVDDVLQNRCNRIILQRLGELRLPDAWLVAGCLFQTAWNLASGRAPQADIRDYDLFYFDPSDLSAPAEQAIAARAKDLYRDLGVIVEAKNQARVHTWYAAWFGHPYAPLRDTRDGIDHFLVRCTCVGLRPYNSGVELYAPNGLDELYGGILRPNPLTDHADLFASKTASYRQRWPWLRNAP